MITFTSTRDNDFLIDEGSMRLSTEAVAVASVARHYAQTILGEMIHKTRNGIPFWPTVFDRVSEAQFSAALQRRLLEIPEIKALTDIEIFVTKNMLQYSCTLITIYGEEILQGELRLPS